MAYQWSLRPVLMTSAATVFGHLPLVFVSGPERRSAQQHRILLVTGMVVGTLFTLIVVPVFYSLLASKHQRIENTESDSSLTPRCPPYHGSAIGTVAWEISARPLFLRFISFHGG